MLGSLWIIHTKRRRLLNRMQQGVLISSFEIPLALIFFTVDLRTEWFVYFLSLSVRGESLMISFTILPIEFTPIRDDFTKHLREGVGQ